MGSKTDFVSRLLTGLGVEDFKSRPIYNLLGPAPRQNPIAPLDLQAAYCVFAAGAFMKQAGIVQGAERHCRFKRLLDAGVRTESDLRSWMHASFPSLNAGKWDNCRKKADEFLESGVYVFRWDTPGNPPPETPNNSGISPSLPPTAGPGSGHCPAVLFVKGGPDFDLPLLAVFNSRKPRIVSPDSNWLRALRFFFRGLEPREIALAGSTGTLTYDLAGAYALRSGLSQLLVVPFPLLMADRELSNKYGEGATPVPVLSCMLDTAACSPKRIPLCRDRVLAVLAGLHLVLEIRSGGNLLAILEEIQAKSPRSQFILEPGEQSSSSAGNYTLLASFPQYSIGFKLPRSSIPAARTHLIAANKNSPEFSKAGPPGLSGQNDFAWGDYLFHYTRVCAGPWPGQTYHEYLVNLLDGHPLSGHSALETLIRIIEERLIRAGARMVRGPVAVISWSSHPPQELFFIRKWSRALVRWTVEPYGVAVRRDVLRSLGAKPAIYGSEQIYSRLAEPERYRFQLSSSTSSASWKHEREWRLRGDLALCKIGPDQGFVFVQTRDEKEKLCSLLNHELPIAVLKP